MPMATQSTTAGFHQFSGFNSSLLLVRTSYFTSGRQPNHPNCSCHLFKGLALTKIWLLEMFQFDSTGVGVSRLPYSYFGICICQFHDKYQSYKYERNTAGKSARWGWGGGSGSNSNTNLLLGKINTFSLDFKKCDEYTKVFF